MRSLGRALQFAGLIALPAAIVLQLNGLPLRDMLLIMVAGMASFYLGRIIEGYATPRI
jgi:hypothetical protein